MDGLAKVAEWDWRMHYDPSEDPNIVLFLAPDRRRRGAWIGPLVNVPMGMTTRDDDGEEMLDLEGVDGALLYAVAAVPQLARLVTWAHEAIEKLNPIHFDSATEAGRFNRELRERLRWLVTMVAQRDETLSEGYHL